MFDLNKILKLKVKYSSNSSNFLKFQNQIHYNQLYQSDYDYDYYDYYGDNYDTFIHDNYMRETYLIQPQHRKSFFGRVLSKLQYFSRPILSERQAIAPLLGPIFAGILGLVAFAGKFYISVICL